MSTRYEYVVMVTEIVRVCHQGNRDWVFIFSSDPFCFIDCQPHLFTAITGSLLNSSVERSDSLSSPLLNVFNITDLF